MTTKERGEPSQKFVWLPLEIDPNIDISDFLDSEGKVNPRLMNEAIKKEIAERHRRTQKWQNWALTHLSIPSD